MPRPIGSANKNKKFLLNRLQDMYGEEFHPIMSIAANCKELQDKAEAVEIPELPKEPTNEELEAYSEAVTKRIGALRIANSEWSRIAEYTEPKLKSVEIDLNADVEGLTFEMHYGGKPKKTKK